MKVILSGENKRVIKMDEPFKQWRGMSDRGTVIIIV